MRCDICDENTITVSIHNYLPDHLKLKLAPPPSASICANCGRCITDLLQPCSDNITGNKRMIYNRWLASVDYLAKQRESRPQAFTATRVGQLVKFSFQYAQQLDHIDKYTLNKVELMAGTQHCLSCNSSVPNIRLDSDGLCFSCALKRRAARKADEQRKTKIARMDGVLDFVSRKIDELMDRYVDGPQAIEHAIVYFTDALTPEARANCLRIGAEMATALIWANNQERELAAEYAMSKLSIEKYGAFLVNMRLTLEEIERNDLSSSSGYTTTSSVDFNSPAYKQEMAEYIARLNDWRI